MGWLLFFMGVVIVLCIIGAAEDNKNKSSLPRPSSPPTPIPPSQNRASSITPSLEEAIVSWHHSETSHPDLDELLKSQIGMRDLVTGESFCHGDEVYLCRICKLAHLKKSWEFMNNRCERSDCKGGEAAKLYRIPLNITWKDFGN